MEVVLADKPGQLMMVIEPISKRGGNFLGIHHMQDRSKEGFVPVVFNFELESLNQLDQIKNDLKKAGIRISCNLHSIIINKQLGNICCKCCFIDIT